MFELRIQRADLTQLDVAAIVNAANERMLGGGGVDGAIHRAAGPELLAACREVPEVRPGVRCPTGEARMTPGFRLPAAYVIHTVGPIWRGGGFEEETRLGECYRASLALARAHALRSIAFPAISCGVYGFPKARAAEIAVCEVLAHAKRAPTRELVVLAAFDLEMLSLLERARQALEDTAGPRN